MTADTRALVFRHCRKDYILTIHYDAATGYHAVDFLYSLTQHVRLPRDTNQYRNGAEAQKAAMKQIDAWLRANPEPQP